MDLIFCGSSIGLAVSALAPNLRNPVPHCPDTVPTQRSVPDRPGMRSASTQTLSCRGVGCTPTVLHTKCAFVCIWPRYVLPLLSMPSDSCYSMPTFKAKACGFPPGVRTTTTKTSNTSQRTFLRLRRTESTARLLHVATQMPFIYSPPSPMARARFIKKSGSFHKSRNID